MEKMNKNVCSVSLMYIKIKNRFLFFTSKVESVTGGVGGVGGLISLEDNVVTGGTSGLASVSRLAC